MAAILGPQPHKEATIAWVGFVITEPRELLGVRGERVGNNPNSATLK